MLLFQSSSVREVADFQWRVFSPAAASTQASQDHFTVHHPAHIRRVVLLFLHKWTSDLSSELSRSITNAGAGLTSADDCRFSYFAFQIATISFTPSDLFMFGNLHFNH